MNTQEWALLIFSILTQLAVGMTLVLMIVRTYAIKKLGEEKTARLTNLSFYAMVPIMALALLASLFHLGKVLNIIGAVPNLGTSWISREVVLAVLFLILAAVVAFLLWRKVSSGTVAIVGWITAVVGLVLIYAMGMVYMLPAQPAWNSLNTPITFFITTFLVGVLGTATFLVASYLRMKDASVEGFVKGTLQVLAISGIVLLALEFVAMPIYLAYLSTQGVAALHSLRLMVGEFGSVLALRLLLVFAGVCVLAYYLYKRATTSETLSPSLVYTAFAVVILGEVLSRYLFYATHFRIGV
jgi:anaerobic dimethyl sulfoxide reductase subunit C (anchor subunit)